jgi:pimeloyl-ACP methyl ester carboxylesterase
VPTRTDDAEIAGHHPLAVEVKEPREELASGKVAGGPEDNQNAVGRTLGLCHRRARYPSLAPSKPALPVGSAPVDPAMTPLHRGGDGPPLLCLHGITDTWRTWELVLPELECHHDVLAPTQAGHAGGPELETPVTQDSLPAAIERIMDEAGFATAHIVGNSLGGWVALQLAARGRARSVVALAPGGGWQPGGSWERERHEHFLNIRQLSQAAAPHAESIVSSPEGRRRVTEFTTVHYEDIPADLLAHQIRGVAECEGLEALLDLSAREGYELDADAITCPVRIVWGHRDRILAWPDAAVRFREEWLPDADWIELDDVGHCPQLDVPDKTAELILSFTSA